MLIYGVPILIRRSLAQRRVRRTDAPRRPPDVPTLDDLAAFGSWQVLLIRLAFGLGAIVLLPWVLVFVVEGHDRNPIIALAAALIATAFGITSLACLGLLLAWVIGRCLIGFSYALAAAGGGVLGYATGGLPLLPIGTVFGCIAGALLIDGARSVVAGAAKRREEAPAIRPGLPIRGATSSGSERRDRDQSACSIRS